MIFHFSIFGYSKNKVAPERLIASSGEWVTSPVVAPRLEQRFFQSTIAYEKVSYHIYTPELYDSLKDRRFPVIYWLQGHGGGSAGLAKLVEHFDEAIRKGKLNPVVIVFPNGMAESMWCNSKDGKTPMEDVFINELIPQIDSNFRTFAFREGRLIEGFSMGGYGAARLGLKYSELFGAISNIAGGPMQKQFDATTGPGNLAPDRVRILKNVYGDDQAYFLAQTPWVMAEKYASGKQKSLRMRIVVGNLDVMLGPNQDFQDLLTRLQMAHEFTILPNIRHEPISLFQALGDTNWNFYSSIFSGVSSKVNDTNLNKTLKPKMGTRNQRKR